MTDPKPIPFNPVRLAVGIPSGSSGCVATAKILAIRQCPLVEYFDYREFGCSALTLAHNLAWCWAVNGFRAERFTHFLLIHSDVRPVHDHWIEVLLSEMERSKADVLGCFISIKNPLGLTSTAIDTDPWMPQRLTLTQARRLPVTWTHPKLLVNTGLLLFRLAAFTLKPICFTVHDQIVEQENGELMPYHQPEDWDVSRQIHNYGLSLYVTRAVGIEHLGQMAFPNGPAWGVGIDPLCVRGSHIEVIGADSSTTEIDLSHDSTMGAEDRLPHGWFSPADIEMYRHVYEELVPYYGTTAEIGVYQGRSLLSVADIIKKRGIMVYCVDTFDRSMPSDSSDRLSAFIQSAKNAGIFENLVILNGDSTVMSQRVPDDSLDFAFIDADHAYGSVRADIMAWRPKLKPTGWMGGHDYNEGPVRKAVNEQFPIGDRHLNTSIWLTRVEA